MKQRHHHNPFLKHFCPNIHSAFRKQDIIALDSAAHVMYHAFLERDEDYHTLFAEIEELDHDRTCGEFEFAECLDVLWEEFLRTHPQFDFRKNQHHKETT